MYIYMYIHVQGRKKSVILMTPPPLLIQSQSHAQVHPLNSLNCAEKMLYKAREKRFLRDVFSDFS